MTKEKFWQVFKEYHKENNTLIGKLIKWKEKKSTKNK